MFGLYPFSATSFSGVIPLSYFPGWIPISNPVSSWTQIPAAPAGSWVVVNTSNQP